MKDIDFDELDRAVSTVLSGRAASTAPSSSVPGEDTPDVGTNSDSNEQPTVSINDSSSDSRSNSASIAKRRSGRFMDVVHPSSDMKTATMTNASRAEVGGSVKSVREVPQQENTEKMPPDTSYLPEESEPSPIIDNNSEPTPDWPDPIDAQNKDKKENLSQGDKGGVSKPVTSADVEPPVELPPQTSPFLPDTKVEKRPLGGLADGTSSSDNAESAVSNKQTPAPESKVLHDMSDTTTQHVSTELNKSSAADDRQVKKQVPENLDDTKAPLPPELDSNLMAIESGESTVPKETEATPQEQPAPAPPKSPTEHPAILMNSSIPQQYAEQPSSGDSSHASIYDTDVAHEALMHPAKKKSGWLWVLWIALILIASMVLGATVYFLELF